MFDDLLIHPRTLDQLQQFVKRPSHGLILAGPKGAGKKRVAEAVARELLKANDLNKYPYFSLTDPEENSITIDEVRSLQKLLQLRTPGVGNNIRRVLCVIDAGRMRQEAQNAFLKSLEEPPVDTCIILTADASGELLPTIFSRMQRIDILPVPEASAQSYFSKRGITATELTRNYALSQGQAGLLHALLLGESEHELKAWVETGKQLLGKPPGERLLQTDELSKDKLQTALLINALGRIVHAALFNASKARNLQAVKKWRNGLEAVQEARSAMDHNANTKLLLDNLLLNL